mmetsp:Transcript_49435/g.112194  ORF Transcript_49435/g.112194 Transcript_49435/m.112194 type:complete len:203 (+) Transcript_49435:1961-2569(+)
MSWKQSTVRTSFLGVLASFMQIEPGIDTSGVDDADDQAQELSPMDGPSPVVAKKSSHGVSAESDWSTCAAAPAAAAMSTDDIVAGDEGFGDFSSAVTPVQVADQEQTSATPSRWDAASFDFPSRPEANLEVSSSQLDWMSEPAVVAEGIEPVEVGAFAAFHQEQQGDQDLVAFLRKLPDLSFLLANSVIKPQSALLVTDDLL